MSCSVKEVLFWLNDIRGRGEYSCVFLSFLVGENDSMDCVDFYGLLVDDPGNIQGSVLR